MQSCSATEALEGNEIDLRVGNWRYKHKKALKIENQNLTVLTKHSTNVLTSLWLMSI